MTRSIEKNGGTNGSSSFFTTHCAEFFCPTHGSISSLTHDANPDLCGLFITLFASSRWGGVQFKNGKVRFLHPAIRLIEGARHSNTRRTSTALRCRDYFCSFSFLSMSTAFVFLGSSCKDFS